MIAGPITIARMMVITRTEVVSGMIVAWLPYMAGMVVVVFRFFFIPLVSVILLFITGALS